MQKKSIRIFIVLTILYSTSFIQIMILFPQCKGTNNYTITFKDIWFPDMTAGEEKDVMVKIIDPTGTLITNAIVTAKVYNIKGDIVAQINLIPPVEVSSGRVYHQTLKIDEPGEYTIIIEAASEFDDHIYECTEQLNIVVKPPFPIMQAVSIIIFVIIAIPVGYVILRRRLRS